MSSASCAVSAGWTLTLIWSSSAQLCSTDRVSGCLVISEPRPSPDKGCLIVYLACSCVSIQGLDAGAMRPEIEDGELAPLKQFIFDQRWLVRQLVEDNRFNQAFLGITIVNTLFLAMAYDGMHLSPHSVMLHGLCRILA